MKHSRKKAGMRPAQAQRHMDALAEGGMRPALYYTNQGQAAGPQGVVEAPHTCLLYTSPSPRDRQKSRMPSSA